MKVSHICLGTMMFGTRANADHEECIRIIQRGLDAGINFVDTADMYSKGESEQIVGKALRGHRDDIILATKVHMPMSSDLNHQGNSRRWIRKEIEASLKRLDTDWVDLYQIHRPDPSTDIEETLSVLTDLIREGKVRAIGCSTFPPELIVEAHWAAERRSLERFRCEQPPYSIFDRRIEESVLPVAERYGMGVMTYAPLASGWLSGRYRVPEDIDLSKGRPSTRPERFDPALDSTRQKLEIVAKLNVIALDASISLTHLAISFVTSHRAVTSAIIGPRTQEQIEGILGGTDVVLNDEILDCIDAVVAPGASLDGERHWTSPALRDASLRR